MRPPPSIALLLLCLSQLASNPASGQPAATAVDSLVGQAELLRESTRFAEAWAVLCRADSVALKTFGAKNLPHANCLKGMAWVRTYEHRFSEGERLLFENLKTIEAALGTKGPDYVDALTALGLFYKAWAHDNPRAEAAFLRCLQLADTLHLDTDLYNFGLGLLYRDNMGELEKSEAFLKKVADSQRAQFGEKSADYLFMAAQMMDLYAAMDDGARFRPFLLDYLRLTDSVPDQPDENRWVALAEVSYYQYHFEKDFGAAVSTLKRRGELIKKEGKHPGFLADNLYLTARAYRAAGRLDSAELCLRQSLVVLDSVVGKEHQTYVEHLIWLGQVLMAEGKPVEGIAFLKEAARLSEFVSGAERPFYLLHLTELAEAQAAAADLDGAAATFTKLASAYRSALDGAALRMGEGRLLVFLDQLRVGRDALFSFLENHPERTDLCGKAFDVALMSNEWILGNAVACRNLVGLADSAAQAAFARLQDLRSQLDFAQNRPEKERRTDEILQLQHQSDEMEAEVFKKISALSAAAATVSREEVQAALGPGGAAVEFVRYHYRDWAAEGLLGPQVGFARCHFKPEQPVGDPVRYAALVVRAGDAGPVFVPLFEEGELSEQLAASAAQGGKAWLYGSANHPSPLYRLLWQPLETLLEGVGTVRYAPTGLIGRLNLGAVADRTGRPMSERFDVGRMGSTRDLVQKRVELPPGRGAVVFGGLEYAADSAALARADSLPSLMAEGASRCVKEGFESIFSQNRLRFGGVGGHWAKLPGAGAEAQRAADLLRKHGIQTTLLTGAAGTEESVRRLRSPLVLMFATHGFYAKADGEWAARLEDPMRRSGLALAGADRALPDRPPCPARGDGLLTAAEAALLDLRGTELVVLSACQSGLGELRGDEGSYGLCRAFKLAGARSVLMTLWPVDDEASKLLMAIFFEKWLEGGRTKPAALQEAQAWMRANGYDDPKFWAGYVVEE